MKLPKFKSIYTKFVIMIVVILLVSSSLALIVVSSLTVNLLYAPLVDMMQKTSTELAMLNQQSNLSNNELAMVTGNTFMNVSFYNTAEEMLLDVPTISKDGIEAIKNQTLERFIPEKIVHQKASLYLVTKLENQWVLIRPIFNSEVFTKIGQALRTVLGLSVLFTTVFVLIALKQIVKPIKRLTQATKQVAGGNLDVVVSHKSEDEIGVLIKNFNVMTQELKTNEYLRKDFVSSVSHEFKTPIASISGFAKIIKQNDLDAQSRSEYADIIISETERLSKLSSNLLRLSSLDNQCIIDKTHYFSLDEQIRRIILLLEARWTEKNLDLDLEIEPLQIVGDEELLWQVWINLIDNAIKFSNQDGQLNIKAYRDMKSVIVEVSDTGIGMSEGTKNRIFERFYQGDSAHASDGNGLGLSIVKRIVDLYDGSIQVESQIGNGTTFIVKLPSIQG